MATDQKVGGSGVGRYTPFKPATPEVQRIADQVKPELERRTGEVYKTYIAKIYRTQVVAGLNYEIKIYIDDGVDKYVDVIVYQSPNGTISLVDYEVKGYGYGGYSPSMQATPGIQIIADKVKPQLEKQSKKYFKTYKAETYRVQVVAGYNYRIEVFIDHADANYVEITVFEGLHGEDFVLTDYKFLEELK